MDIFIGIVGFKLACLTRSSTLTMISATVGSKVIHFILKLISKDYI